MTHVAFHFNVPAIPEYLCRLLKKATTAGHRSWVLVPADQLQDMSTRLWTFSQADFIGHAVASTAAAGLMRRSAVVLADAEPGPDDPAGWTLLVNTLPPFPGNPSAYDRVVEMVSNDASSKVAARQRWKRYREVGFDIEQHDVSQWSPS
jgi:DNA polymerase-3 subunit chi